MQLNTLQPAKGSKKQHVRLGRGIGSGKGKTCGFGHKGQTARSGYSRKMGFEGGQMPLQRRVPKFGFKNLASEEFAEVRLGELHKLSTNDVNLIELQKANIIGKGIKRAKIILSGKIEKAVTVSGIGVTAGARKAIEALGGKIIASN